MTQEEKLKLAREWYNDQNTTQEEKNHLLKLVPELKKNDDEKIKNELIDFIKRIDFIPEKSEKLINWIKKQCVDISSFPEEQRKYMEKYVNLDKTTLVKLLAERDENIEESLKASICDECEHPTLNCGNFPCDKVKPKFKVGDWVVNNETGTIYQVKEIVKLNCGYGYNLTDDGYISSFKSDDYHLWTIQDAKDGDILIVGDEYGEGVAICGKDDAIGNNILYCIYDDENGFNVNVKIAKECLLHPANIEQGELLFKNINEAGYVWDPEQKELKQIKQNTAWSEEDNCYYDDIREILINLINSPKSNVNKDVVQKDLDWLRYIKENYIQNEI